MTEITDRDREVAVDILMGDPDLEVQGGRIAQYRTEIWNEAVRACGEMVLVADATIKMGCPPNSVAYGECSDSILTLLKPTAPCPECGGSGEVYRTGQRIDAHADSVVISATIPWALPCPHCTGTEECDHDWQPSGIANEVWCHICTARKEL